MESVAVGVWAEKRGKAGQKLLKGSSRRFNRIEKRTST